MEIHFKIKKISTGNCTCRNCKAENPEKKQQPVTLWYKFKNEKRGHNEPVCSVECAKLLAQKIKTEHKI